MNKDLVPRELPIVGPEHLVRTTLATQIRRGTLVTPPDQIRLTRLASGAVSTRVTLLLPPPVSWRKQHPVLTVLLIVTAVLAVLAGAGYALALAAHRAMAVIDGSAALGGLVLAGVLLLLFLANRTKHRGACPGVAVHCNGCRH